MKNNANFNLSHSLLKTVREVLAAETKAAGSKKPKAKKDSEKVMVAKGKSGGVKMIDKNKYNPNAHVLADEKKNSKKGSKKAAPESPKVKLSGKQDPVEVSPRLTKEDTNVADRISRIVAHYRDARETVIQEASELDESREQDLAKLHKKLAKKHYKLADIHASARGRQRGDWHAKADEHSHHGGVHNLLHTMYKDHDRNKKSNSPEAKLRVKQQEKFLKHNSNFAINKSSRMGIREELAMEVSEAAKKNNNGGFDKSTINDIAKWVKKGWSVEDIAGHLNRKPGDVQQAIRAYKMSEIHEEVEVTEASSKQKPMDAYHRIRAANRKKWSKPTGKFDKNRDDNKMPGFVPESFARPSFLTRADLHDRLAKKHAAFVSGSTHHQFRAHHSDLQKRHEIHAKELRALHRVGSQRRAQDHDFSNSDKLIKTSRRLGVDGWPIIESGNHNVDEAAILKMEPYKELHHADYPARADLHDRLAKKHATAGDNESSHKKRLHHSVMQNRHQNHAKELRAIHSQGQTNQYKVASSNGDIKTSKRLGVREEVEQVDELSKKTLGSYVAKASAEAQRGSASLMVRSHEYEKQFKKNKRIGKGDGDRKINSLYHLTRLSKLLAHHRNEIDKKNIGIGRALNKLTKEDIDEANSPIKTGNPGKGFHGEHPTKDADAAYRKAHSLVKKHASAHLHDVKKPNVMITHYLDSVHGRHLAGVENDPAYIHKDFGKFKKSYNSDDFKK